jgi:hypothetical protein
VAGLEIKHLRAGGSTNFVDVFEKLGKQMQDRIAAAEKPEKSRTAEVTHFDRTNKLVFILEVCEPNQN